LLITPTPSTLIYTLSLLDALPISPEWVSQQPHSQRATVASQTPMGSVGLVKGPSSERPATTRTRRKRSPDIADSCALTTLGGSRSEEHTSELQSRFDLVCRLLLEK